MSKIMQDQSLRHYLLAKSVEELCGQLRSRLKDFVEAEALLFLKSFVNMDGYVDRETIISQACDNLLTILVLLNAILFLDTIAPDEDPVYVRQHSSVIDTLLNERLKRIFFRKRGDSSDSPSEPGSTPSLF